MLQKMINEMRKHYTQVELAKMIGISQSKVSKVSNDPNAGVNYESGKRIERAYENFKTGKLADEVEK